MKRIFAIALLAIASPVAAGDYRSTLEDGAVMYDAPSVHAKKLFVTSRHYPVEIVVNIDSWVKVRDQTGTLAWMEKKALSDKRTVMVTVPVAEVRQKPDEKAPVLFRAQQGVALELAEPGTSGWARVRHADGQTGYVRINQVWGI